MDNLLNGFFGISDKDDEGAKTQRVNDFVSRVEEGNKAEGYAPEEALTNYANVSKNVSGNTFETLAADALGQFSPNERQEFAQLINQESGMQIDPNTTDPQQLAGVVSQLRNDGSGLLGSLLQGGQGGDMVSNLIGGLLGGGQGGMQQGAATSQAQGNDILRLLQNPIVKMLLALIAANAMKRLGGNSGGGNGIDSIFGGSQGGQQQPAPSAGSGSQGGLGGLIDSIFGGGDDNQAQQPAQQQPSQRQPDQSSGGSIIDQIFGGGNDEKKKKNDDTPDFGGNVKAKNL